jgi:hypothetical protein
MMPRTVSGAHGLPVQLQYPGAGRLRSIKEVQRAAGRAGVTTTNLYDRRGYNPEKSATFFASY